MHSSSTNTSFGAAIAAPRLFYPISQIPEPYPSTKKRIDFGHAQDELQPDIVSIATPAAPHRELAEYAAGRGCHIVCDKPLATNTADARAMLAAVECAGVKHGYAATGRYTPAILQTRLLLAQDALGPVREIESYLHMNLPAPGLPYSWIRLLDQGGGLLNNVFTHKLAQVLYATQGTDGWAIARRSDRLFTISVTFGGSSGLRSWHRPQNGAPSMRTWPTPSHCSCACPAAIQPMRSFAAPCWGPRPGRVPGHPRRRGLLLHDQFAL